MPVTLSHLAKADLDEIKDYTIERWGRDKWLDYFAGLANAFETISDNPDASINRDLFYKEMKSLPYGEHLIFYKRIKANNDNPVILRIVHQRQNLPALLYYEELKR